MRGVAAKCPGVTEAHVTGCLNRAVLRDTAATTKNSWARACSSSGI